MTARLLVAIACVTLCVSATPAAQNDLDALMARVLAKRDDNWKKLQQYVLNERESLQITGPAARPVYGGRREYLWFPRDGQFIRSPLTVDGVTISEADRRKAEAFWVTREAMRKKRQEAPAADNPDGKKSISIMIGPGGVSVSKGGEAAITEEAIRDALEPGFVSSAYFLNFKFEPGHYALVGRETFADRSALKIEYYPEQLFKEGRTRPNKEVRKRNQDVERQMNKVALVTLWVLPDEGQIVKYEFSNIDMDFLPAQWLLRFNGITARMEMSQPFPSVWLPKHLEMGFNLSSAAGDVDGRYTSDYFDYRLAAVSTRIR